MNPKRSTAISRFLQLNHLGVVLCLFLPLASNAAEIAPAKTDAGPAAVEEESTPTIIEAGANHRIWKYGTNTVTELADGLNYFDGVSWQPSEEKIEALPDGSAAVAQKGMFRARFAANLNSAGSIELTMDAATFRSHIGALVYYDWVLGKSTIIAVLKDSIAQLPQGDSSKIIYPDALDGAVCDVQYTYRRGSFEQDLVILRRLPEPESFGFSSKSTRIQLWTEFIAAPTLTVQKIISHQDFADANQDPPPSDLPDQVLCFGPVSFGRGKAFKVDDQAAKNIGANLNDDSLDVGKEWVTADGRNFLVESLEYSAAEPILKSLPPVAVNNAGGNKNVAQATKRSNRRQLAGLMPKAPQVGKNQQQRVQQVAQLTTSGGPRLVMDYITQATANPAGYTFKSDSTYFITGLLTIGGLTTLESAVIKFTNYNASAPAQINISGSGARLICRTSPYRPAIFTSKDDNSVGEIIANSTGTPSGQYGSYALYFDYNSSGVLANLSNIRVKYTYYGINFSGGAGHVVSHAQMVNCYYPFVLYYADVSVRNALIYGASKVFDSSSSPTGASKVRNENVTISQCYNLGPIYYGYPMPVYMTNCLMTTGLVGGSYYYGQNTYSVATTAFTSVGVGYHYLNGNTYRNVGTIAINPQLLDELRGRTTVPPHEQVNNFSSTTILPQSVARDTGNLVDLGYHYAPLDEVWSGKTLTSTLILTQGVAVGIYGSTGTTLGSGAQFISEGTPLKTNHLVRYSAVQEFGPWGTTNATMSLINVTTTHPILPQIRMRFTEVSLQGDTGSRATIVDIPTSQALGTLSFMDCQIRGGRLNIATPGNSSMNFGFTNNIFERPYLVLNKLTTPFTVDCWNNLFVGGTISWNGGSTPAWNIYDNLFDGTTITAVNINNDYNGYIGVSPMSGSGSHYKSITTRDFQVGSLGTNYYPTTGGNLSTLIGAGSRSAASATLYHHTVKLDQTKEANGMVSIGYHYIALNVQSLPYDTDNNAIPDYIADANGNGVSDGDEPSYSNPSITLSLGETCHKVGDGPTVIDSGAVATDTDSQNFNNGQLTVTLTSGAASQDSLAVQNEGTGSGQIGVSGANVTYSGTIIGTFIGGVGTTPLVVTFNASSIPNAVQALVRHITYQFTATIPATLTRTAQFVLTDGRGGTSGPATKTINLLYLDAGPPENIFVPGQQTLPWGLRLVKAGVNGATAICHNQVLNRLVVSMNCCSGFPFNLALLSPSGDLTSFTTEAGMHEEILLTSAIDQGGGKSLAGFNSGDILLGNGLNGGIDRISGDGASVLHPWVTVSRVNIPNTPINGLCIDQYGVPGLDGKLVVVTVGGDVWKIGSQISNPSTDFICNIPHFLEGVTVIPPDTDKYGTWAGKIVAAAEHDSKLFVIDPTSGASYEAPGLSFEEPEDIQVIPPNQNFYAIEYTSAAPAHAAVWGAPAAAFSAFVGDIIVAEEHAAKLWRIHWDGTAYHKYEILTIPSGSPRPVQWEHFTFSRAGLANISEVPSITLNGTVLHSPSCPVTLTWTQDSGPGIATFGDLHSAITTAAFTLSGEYSLRLTASACQCSLSRYVSVTVRGNQPPIVDGTATPSSANLAGSHASISVNLDGTVTDDGLPTGGIITKAWSFVSGPASANLAANPNFPNAPEHAVATMRVPGEYVFRFAASDSLLSASKDVHVTVTKVNAAPEVGAGPSQDITLSDRVYLPGWAWDDGLPIPTTLTVTWSKQSGDGTVTFDDIHQTNTFASFSAVGQYTLLLTATDGTLSSSATVTVTVNPRSQFEVFRNAKVESAGVGGMRGQFAWNYNPHAGSGAITLKQVAGTISKAYLYWHGPTDSSDPQINSEILVNGRLVVGHNIGVASDNGWNCNNSTVPRELHRFANSQGYRADVTDLVRTFGRATYSLTNLFKSSEIDVNGASLIVFYEDGNNEGNSDFVLYDGNDSNSPRFFADKPINSVALGAAGEILIAGTFEYPHNPILEVPIRNCVAKLMPNGAFDARFDPRTGINVPSEEVRVARFDAQGRILIGGLFSAFNGQVRQNLARLSATGTLDASFLNGSNDGMNGPVETLVPLAGGKLIVGGAFTTVNGIAANRLVRLNQNGSIDTTFAADQVGTPVSVNGTVYTIIIQSDGKLLIGGDFSTVNGVQRSGIARLSADGSVDENFAPGSGGSGVRSIVVQSDRNIVVAGTFTTFAGSPRNRIARVGETGVLDQGFPPQSGSGANDAVKTLLVDSANRLYLGGLFTSVNGENRNRIARLSADGSLDLAFNPGLGPDAPAGGTAEVRALALEPDGKLLVAGNFPSFNQGIPVYRLARLQTSGGLDTQFVSSDAGWSVSFENLSYTSQQPVYLELHVSDGQPKELSVLHADPRVLLNGIVWLVPEIPEDHPEAEWQIFAGLSVPSANYTDIIHGLWDIKQQQVPFAALQATSGHSLLLTNAPGEGDDALSLIAAILKLPVGSTAAASGIGHVSPPTTTPPRTRPDHFVVRREIGRQVLNVVGNDEAADGTILRISMVTQPSNGRTEIVRNESAILYRANPAFTGQDAFTYVVVDHFGNRASADVTVEVAGTDPIRISLNGNIAGTLNSADASTSVRGGSQHADFYEFEALAGDTHDISVAPQSFAAHMYLRGPDGQILSAATHAEYSRGASFSDARRFDRTGTYTLEVTSHFAEEEGAYNLSFSKFHNQAIEFILNGVSYRPNETADLGLLQPPRTNDIIVRNISGSTIGSTESASSFNPVPPNSQVSPGVLPILPPGASSRHTLVIGAPPPGTTGTIRKDLGIFGVWGMWLEYHVNDTDLPLPSISLSQPSDNSSYNSPASVRMTALPVIGANGHITKVTFFATQGGRTVTIGSRVSSPWTLDWMPDTPGKYLISAIAYEQGSDSKVRAAASLAINISIVDPPRNAPVLANDDEARTYVDKEVVIDVLANDSDPDGDQLTIIEITNGENGGNVQISSNGKRVSYTPPPQTYGLDRFSYLVSDGRNGTRRASVLVHIVERSLYITSPANGSSCDPGTPVPVAVNATSSESTIVQVELLVNGIAIATNFAQPFGFSFTAPSDGLYKIGVVSHDDHGQANESQEIFIAAGGSDHNPPMADFLNLAEGQVVRDARLELFGVADTEDVLYQSVLTYSLDLFKAESGQLTFLKSYGSNVHQGIPAGGSFGLLDFSMLQNGVYVLRLYVTDQSLDSTHEVRFVIDNDAKIGQFIFTETDLVVPVLGVPISLSRTYDSYNTRSGDFGFAWSYALNDMNVQFDEIRSEKEFEGGTAMMRTGGGRNVTLTLPNGRRTTFLFSLEPGPSDGDAPCLCYVAQWNAPPGIHAKLGPIDNNRLQFIPWQNVIPPYWAAAGPATPIENFDFSGFILTNSDGTEYTIRRDQGPFVDLDPDAAIVQGVQTWTGGKLTRIRHRDGSRVEISNNNIDQFRPDSPADAPTHSLYFDRVSGRITAIYTAANLGPDGLPVQNALPAVKYFYNGSVLSEVHRLTDRNKPAGQQYAKTRYTTLNSPPYYRITKIERWLPADTWVTVAEPQYDADQRFTGSKDGVGRSAAIQHDLAARTEMVTDPQGNVTFHQYDSRGNVTRTTDALGRTTSRAYDASNNMISEVDPLGNETNYEYDPNGNRTKIRDPLGNISTYLFDSLGHMLNSKDANLNAAGSSGLTTTESYNSTTGNLESSTDGEGHTTSYTYDPATQRLTAIIDPEQNRTENEYYTDSESGGRDGDLKAVMVKKNTGPNQFQTVKRTVYTYDANGNRITETQKSLPLDVDLTRDITTKFYYDDQNRLVRTEDPLYDPATPTLHATVTVYNDIGKPLSTTDKLGRVTTYLYDTNANLIETTYPSDQNTPVTVTRTVYDELNRPVYTQERAFRPTPATGTTTANATHTIYDALGRVIRSEYVADLQVAIDTSGSLPFSKVLAIGEVFSNNETTYDLAGRVLASSDSHGNTTTHEYDAAGRQLSVSRIADELLPVTTSYAYDPNGNQLSFTDALGRSTESFYDKLNRRVAVRHPLLTGQAQRFQDLTGYDLLGRRILETNKAGVVTAFGYDLLGHLTSVTNDYHAIGSNPFVTRYGYDEFDNLLSQTDAENHTTLFWYNKLGQRTRRILPGNQFEQLAYDAAGNQIQRTDFREKVTTFQYDALNRLVAKIPDQSFNAQPITFAYTLFGKRNTMDDASGHTIYHYDTQHRLDYRTTPEGQVDYAYGSQGLLKTIYGHRMTDNYTWNRLGQLTAVQSDLSPTTYAYDLVGNLLGVTNANGVVTRYTYDEMNRLRDVEINKNNTGGNPPALAHYTYTVGPSGNRTSVTERSARQVNYSYDGLYRLTSEAIDNDPQAGTISYTHDHVGNRLSRNLAGATQSLADKVPPTTSSYNQNDWLDSDTYDANGNTTGSGGNTDTYDFEDRLISRNNGQITFVYDGDGNRVQKTIGGVTTYYLIDDQNPTGYAQVMEEHNGSAESPTHVYTYGLTRINEFHGNSPTVHSFYGYDGHGSVRFLTDENGAITDTYTYDAFGILIAKTGTTANNYLYAGEQFDPDLGLSYNRARYLNLGTCRFWTMDTFEGRRAEPATHHKFLYGYADPVNTIDPTGHGGDTGTLPGVSVTTAVLIGLAAVVTYFVSDALVRSGPRAFTLLDPALPETAASRSAEPARTPDGPPIPPLDFAPRRSTDCPTLIISKTLSKMPEIAVHIEQAQQRGFPSKLHRGLGTESFRDKNRRAALRGLGRAPSNKSWDEYPFASSVEGGDSTSIQLVPLDEQNQQGGIINGFYVTEGLVYGDCFFVLIIP